MNFTLFPHSIRWPAFPMRWISCACAIAILSGCASTNSPNDKNTGAQGIRRSDVSNSVFDSKPSSSSGLGLGSGITSPNNIWDRIRQGFKMPNLNSATVSDRESWYARNPESVQRLISRSNRYIYHVVEELERRGMPTELALLPFVESSFDPTAVSGARAAGLWQFVPSTGRDFDLTQDRFLDDRRDVLRSTNAALDYLQRLHDRFGDWHLALAAYNWGQGNVSKAIQRNQSAGLGTSYEELRMPQETRQYVPKLQALKNIVSNPATFNTQLPNVANRPYFQRVDLRQDMDAATIAQLAGISESDFKALNPSLNKPVVMQAITPHILLPKDTVSTFQRNLSAAQGRQLSTWKLWQTPKTMTVAEIAAMLGTTEQTIRSVNRSIPPRMRVTEGSTLLVPRQPNEQGNVSAAEIRYSRISFTPEVVIRRITIKAREGESINQFAQRTGVTVADLSQWNSIDTNRSLPQGMPLVLQVPQEQAARLQRIQANEEAAARAERRRIERIAAERAAAERAAEKRAAAEKLARERQQEQLRQAQLRSKVQSAKAEEDEEEDKPQPAARNRAAVPAPAVARQKAAKSPVAPQPSKVQPKKPAAGRKEAEDNEDEQEAPRKGARPAQKAEPTARAAQRQRPATAQAAKKEEVPQHTGRRQVPAAKEVQPPKKGNAAATVKRERDEDEQPAQRARAGKAAEKAAPPRGKAVEKAAPQRGKAAEKATAAQPRRRKAARDDD